MMKQSLCISILRARLTNYIKEMKHSISAYLISVFFIMGCISPQPLPQIVETEANDTLTFHKVDSIELWCTHDMTIRNHCLVIADYCQKEKLYFYRLNDFQFLKSTGRAGKGPQDFKFPFFLKGANVASDELLIYDAELAKCKTFRINPTSTDSLVYWMKETKIPAEIIASTDMAQIKNTFYGSQDSGKGMFFIHPIESDRVEWVPYPPSIPNYEEAPEANLSVKQNRITVNPNKKRIATAMKFYNQLFLYNTKGEVLKGGTFREEIAPKIVNNQIDTSTKIFFTQIYSTDKYIYLVLSDMHYREKASSNWQPSQVAIFDWDMNHVLTLKTNIYIYSIVIDSVFNRMLVLSYDKEENPELYYSNWDETLIP